MDMVFPAERTHFPGVHEIGAAISGPRITDKKIFTDTKRIFLKIADAILETSAGTGLGSWRGICEARLGGVGSLQTHYATAAEIIICSAGTNDNDTGCQCNSRLSAYCRRG